MTQLRISEAALLLGVSDDTVSLTGYTATTAAGRFAVADGRRVLQGAALAALAQELASNTDSLDPASGSRSARNHFTGLVTKVTSDLVMSQVELQCGPFRVVSLISTEAVQELGLQVGSLATAVVKATNVTVEAVR